MSRTFTLRACAAAALLLSTTAYAQTATPAAAAAVEPVPAQEAAAPMDMAVLEAFNALSQEVTRAFPWRANLDRTLDDFPSFRYTPEAAEKLKKVFGTDQPLSVKRTASSGTSRSYQLTLHPLEYTMPDGGVFAWAPLTGAIHTAQAGQNYTFDATWPFMKVAMKEATVLLTDMSASGKMRRGTENLWFGAMQFGLKSMTVNGAETFAMEDNSATFKMIERAKLVDIAYAFGAKSIKVAGWEPGSLDITGRITGLPATAMAALLDADERIEAIADPEQQAKQTLEEYKKLAPAFAASGGALHIDRLQLTYKGHAASLKGRLSFRPMKNVAAASPADILKQLDGKLTLRVPVAMLAEIGRGIARAQLEQAKPGQPVNEAQLAEAASNVKDALVGKALGSGLAKLEKGELVSLIVLANGKVTANGKPVDLPAPSANDTPAPQDQAPAPREAALSGSGAQ